MRHNKQRSTLICCGLILASTLYAGCSRSRGSIEPIRQARIELLEYGLPKDFFSAAAEECTAQIIQYRFLVWLNSEDVAVGFSTNPYCRKSPEQSVSGSARILIFDTQGQLKARRDLPYLADGYDEIVADGEARSGPQGTLLFRIQSVNLDPQGRHESKSGVRLLDKNLNDVAQLDGSLEQTTFVDHDLVFQEGFTISGPRSYSVLAGSPPSLVNHWRIDWPIGALSTGFGEQSYAYMLCGQELRPGVYSQSKVIYANARKRCKMLSISRDGDSWEEQLKDGNTAAIVGVLSPNSVVAEINASKEAPASLIMWNKDQPAQTLPWVTKEFSGSVTSATPNLSRYGVIAEHNDGALCKNFNIACSKENRWFVFDRTSLSPLVDRSIPKNSRAVLSPDGLHYASFESGELRIYGL